LWERRSQYGALVGKILGKRHWENAGVDGRIILECSLKGAVGKAWIILIYLRRETSGGIL
jgi:hypothetical protein